VFDSQQIYISLETTVLCPQVCVSVTFGQSAKQTGNLPEPDRARPEVEASDREIQMQASERTGPMEALSPRRLSLDLPLETPRKDGADPAGDDGGAACFAVIDHILSCDGRDAD
jgi:hypothetical protein